MTRPAAREWVELASRAGMAVVAGAALGGAGNPWAVLGAATLLGGAALALLPLPARWRAVGPVLGGVGFAPAFVARGSWPVAVALAVFLGLLASVAWRKAEAPA